MSGTAEGSDKKIGQYPLIKQLGKGGMGSVWYSEHPYLRIPCAIKIMDAKLAKANPEFIQRFIQEGRLAAAISHPNVLKVYDANHEDDLFYMVLEYIDGCDIKKLAEDRGGKLPPEEVIEIAHAIGDALRDAYDNHQIIHRDIKPENILINRQGELKLADLGIGKQISEEQEFNLTMTGVAIGTAYYISPEQAMDSKHIDNRSDIYSFGATLYKLLTGDYPFTARTVTAMMMKHANEPLENPKLKDPSLPDNLCAVICKMMQKKPEDRYSSYSEFLDDINAIREANAPVESLTCAMEGIGSIEKENTPEPPAKKKMHVSKKAAKQVEKPKQKAQTKAPNKNHKTLLVCTIAAALLMIPLALMFNNKKTVQPQVENKATLVQQTNVKAPEQKKKTEKAPKAAVLDAFSSPAPTVEAVSTKPAEVKQVISDSDIVADLEKRLSKANGSHIEIKEYKIEGGEITALDLSDNQTLKDISELRDLPLSYLNLNHCSNLESLNGIQGTNLHELTLISSRPLKVSNLDPVKDLPLKILKVYNMPLLNNLEPLKTTELKTLYLVDCPNIKSLKPLSENVDLKYLEISSKQPSELRSLNGLEKLPLKTLIIENCPQVLSLRPVVNSSLEEIIIRKCSIPESELDLLFQLPLQRIDTGNKNFDNRYWAFIENGRQALHNPENTLDEARDIFAAKPNKGPINPVQNSFGDIQINSLLSGELYIDGKKYANVTAKQTLNIPKLKTGDIHFELKTGKGSVEGIWEVEAGPMNKGLIPNSKLAYSANGLSSILVSKYMTHRLRKPSKPTSPFNREIYQVTQKSLKWFLENR
ncbi:MAG: protein kinase, partial [Lentisphaeraceae bacterium]|nr:protein kinase [Lentisphaeraceae bacterium]